MLRFWLVLQLLGSVCTVHDAPLAVANAALNQRHLHDSRNIAGV